VLVFTDNLPESDQTVVAGQARQLTAGFAAEIVFSEDRGEIQEIIRRHRVELILGSSLEQQLADQLAIPFLSVSFPLTDAVLLQKSYIGVRGAITFVEDLAGRIVSYSSKQAR
jgi:nitrogenase molybdenum-iron protein beta chain